MLDVLPKDMLQFELYYRFAGLKMLSVRLRIPAVAKIFLFARYPKCSGATHSHVQSVPELFPRVQAAGG